MPMTMPQVKTRARTPDRACADGLGQSAISLNRRAVPREAAFWLVGYVFAAVILGTALPAPLYAIYQRQWHFSAGVLTLIFAVYAVAVLATLLLAGRASDQAGRKAGDGGRRRFRRGQHDRVHLRLQPRLALPGPDLVRGVRRPDDRRRHRGTHRDAPARPRRASLAATAANASGAALGPLMAGLFAQYLPQPTVLVFEVFLGVLATAGLALVFIPETVTRRERPTLRFTGLAIPAEGRGEFIAAGVAAFAAYALNGLFASVVPGFTTAMLHHADYAIAGGITCLFFAAGAVAALSLARLNSRPVLLAGLGGFLPGLALVLAGMSTASLVLFGIGAVVAGSSFGALDHGSLSVANRLAPQGNPREVISTYFVFAYSGLRASRSSASGASPPTMSELPAVLGCSVVLAVLCALSAARISGGRRAAWGRVRPVAR